MVSDQVVALPALHFRVGRAALVHLKSSLKKAGGRPLRTFGDGPLLGGSMVLFGPVTDTREFRANVGVMRSDDGSGSWARANGKVKSGGVAFSSLLRVACAYRRHGEATIDAISTMQELLALSAASDPVRCRLEGILSYLHFIRTALLDPRSPLRSFSEGA